MSSAGQGGRESYTGAESATGPRRSKPQAAPGETLDGGSPAYRCFVALSCESNSCHPFFSLSLRLLCGLAGVHARTKLGTRSLSHPVCLRGSAVHSKGGADCTAQHSTAQLAQLLAAYRDAQAHGNRIFLSDLGPRGKWCGEGEWSGWLGPRPGAARRLQRHVMAW